MRLQILRTSAEQKILGPLRTHQWTASIVREVAADSGYLVVQAERAGSKHTIALLYTTGVANSLYRQLEAEVEHVFINGELYKLESFAFGVSTPISVVDDFFDLLLKWNAETEDSFGPPVANEILPVVDENRVIQSDNPIQGIWIRLRQLHSVTLATKTVERRLAAAKATLAPEVTRTKAEGLSFAVRNATDYFPRGSDQKRPNAITSKPANESSRARQVHSYPSATATDKSARCVR